MKHEQDIYEKIINTVGKPVSLNSPEKKGKRQVFLRIA